MFDFDNEIVIGVTKLPKNKNIKQKNKKNLKTKTKSNKIRKEIIEEKPKKEKNTDRINFFIKVIVAITLLLGLLLFLLASPLFEILEIKVEGNSVLTNDEVVKLSRNKCW